MFFPVYFKRQKGAVDSDPAILALGVTSDPVPTVATEGPFGSNVLSSKVGGIGNAIHRLAVDLGSFMNKRVTLKDVAQRAHVSVMTV